MAEPVFDRLGAEGLLIELSSLVTVIRNATEKAGPPAEDMTDGLYFLACLVHERVQSLDAMVLALSKPLVRRET